LASVYLLRLSDEGRENARVSSFVDDLKLRGAVEEIGAGGLGACPGLCAAPKRVTRVFDRYGDAL